MSKKQKDLNNIFCHFDEECVLSHVSQPTSSIRGVSMNYMAPFFFKVLISVVKTFSAKSFNARIKTEGVTCEECKLLQS